MNYGGEEIQSSGVALGDCFSGVTGRTSTGSNSGEPSPSSTGLVKSRVTGVPRKCRLAWATGPRRVCLAVSDWLVTSPEGSVSVSVVTYYLPLSLEPCVLPAGMV